MHERRQALDVDRRAHRLPWSWPTRWSARGRADDACFLQHVKSKNEYVVGLTLIHEEGGHMRAEVNRRGASY